MPCPSCELSHPAEIPCPTLVLHPAPPPAPGTLEDGDPLVGTLVGSFRILRAIGRGGMGTVYLGEHGAIASRVAIKVMHRHLSLDPQMVRRFRAEARATNLIGHENIVRIYDFGNLPDGRYHLVMEYLAGHPLSAWVGSPQPPERAVALLTQICDALEAAHRAGVVHRDLKPENVFVVPRAGGEAVKVLDFGIAKLLAGEGEETRTLAGAILGTPEYMSPEQVGGAPVDARADLYSLGVIAYQLLTGKLPFTGGWAQVMLAHQLEAPPPLEDSGVALPRPLREAVLRALAKRPADRFPSAAALGEALRRSLLPAKVEPPAPAVLAPAVSAPAVIAPAAAAPAPAVIAPAAAAPAPAEPPLLALLTDASGRRAVQLTDLTRGGAFAQLEGPLPALRERVTLELKLAGGRLCAEAEVVQQVPAEAARLWRRSPGVALQFCARDAAFARQLQERMAGKPAEDASREAEAALRAFRSRSPGDLYGLLGVRPEAEFSEIRRAAASALAKLERLKEAKLTADLAEQLQRMLDRVNQAGLVLKDPARRAEHDGRIGNYRGVIRCLAAGLRVSELEGCRRRVRADLNRPPPPSEVRLVCARAWEAQGELDRARAELERALAEDPLHLELHREYGRLSRMAVAAPHEGGIPARAG